MSKPLIDVMNLNLNRYGSTFEEDGFKATLEEELKEIYDALESNDTKEIIDGMADAIVVLAGGITRLGYNPELVLKQVVKEITSRNQNYEQKAKWVNDKTLIGKEKWLKDKTQDPATLYKADFSTCKLHK